MTITSLRRTLHRALVGLRAARASADVVSKVVRDARLYSDPDADVLFMPLRATTTESRQADSLQTTRSRFAQRLQRDPDRARQWQQTRTRLHSLDAESDTIQHFERVTGHRLADFTPRENEAEPIMLSDSDREVAKRVADRKPVHRLRSRPIALATVMTVCILVLGSYTQDSLKTVTGPAATSESILFGSLGERTRGHSHPALELRRAEVLLALERINDARTSVLGFHTGYDPSILEEARLHLERAIAAGSALEPAPSDLVRLRQSVEDILR